MKGCETSTWSWCPANFDCYIDWADHWQTMIAGMLAVGAALLASYLAMGQLSATREQLTTQLKVEEDRRRRTLRAARVALPGVLSGICSHAETVARDLWSAWPTSAKMYPDDVSESYEEVVELRSTYFPQEFVEPLRQISFHADDDAVIQRVASIFQEAQVLDARLRPLASKAAQASFFHIATYIIEAASLYARAESLFAFARQQSDTVDDEDLWQRVVRALNLMKLDTPAIMRLVNEERELGLPPGEGDTDVQF